MEIIRYLIGVLIMPLLVNVLTELFKDWKDKNKKE